MTLAIPVGMELVTAIGSLADKRHRLPDITTFVVHPDYLNRPYLYPRQATLLKVIFLDLEHMTEYDHRVIAEWEADYIASMDKDGVGNNGIVPGILERVRINRICPCGHDRGSHFVQGTTALDKVGTRCDECTDCHRYRGRRWFREVVSVIGRRGSKGHVGALATAYIIAHFIEMGNPQERYGIDRDKRLSAIVFAGKKEQAKANQWRDIVNVILGAPYFTPYISKPQAESLTIRSQSDLLSLREREGRGVHSEQDIATFEILPKESTTIAGRGQAGFLLIFDEAAHVVKGVANSPAEMVYDSASPSLDQFGLDGFIYIPSSPWQKIGLLFDRYNLALEVEEDGSPVYPEMMMIQLTSWDIYKDWERSHEIPMVANRPTPFLHLKGAVQAYDEQMERLERANPETFRVERRSQFAAVLDAYLNPDRIAEIWQEDLPMLSKGTMTVSYRAHADPSTSGAAFAFAIGHRVDPDPKDTDALPMVVFDLIHSWKPEDYDDHQVPYLDITEELKGYLDGFMPAAMTFDQYNATGFIQALKQHVRNRRYPKRVQVYERPATHDLNWKTYETFKTAVGLGLVKAPFHEDANAELTFLQLVGNKRVDHPDAGPVQRKDIADCLAIITYELIGDSIAGFVGKTMGELSVLGAMQGGVDAAGRFAEDAHERMSQFGRTRSSRIKRG